MSKREKYHFQAILLCYLIVRGQLLRKFDNTTYLVEYKCVTRNVNIRFVYRKKKCGGSMSVKKSVDLIGWISGIVKPVLACIALISITTDVSALKNSELLSVHLPDWFVNDSIPPGCIPLTDEQKEDILHKTRATVLPARVDHTVSKYLPPIFDQLGGSCGYSAGFGYILPYEFNNYRDDSVAGLEQMLPTHFAFMLYGQGTNGNQLAEFNGIPTAKVYGGRRGSEIYGWDKNYGWMQGYANWKSAMFNRQIEAVAVDLKDEDGLLLLKKWVYNHWDDTEFQEGGMLGGGVNIGGMGKGTIPAGEYEGGKKIAISFEGGIDHGITWAGYDDSVGYDFNGDGKITNDVDTDNNGVVDLKDWERGALIMLNTYGAWQNNGSIYVPYRFIPFYGNYLKRWAPAPHIRKDYRPTTVLKIKMDYSERVNLRLSIGFANDTTALTPDESKFCEHFKFAGGEKIPMLGHWKIDNTMHTEPMEFGIDLGNIDSYLFGVDTRKGYRYFLTIETKDSSAGVGNVYDLSVIRYTYTGPGPNAGYDSLVFNSSLSNVVIPAGKQMIHIPITMSGDSLNIPKYLYVPNVETSIKSVGGEETSAGNIIDNNLDTKWLLWQAVPQDVVIEIDREYAISGLEYYTRTDGTQYGQVKEFEIFASDDGVSWGSAVVASSWTTSGNAQLRLFNPVKGKFVKYRALSIHGDYKAVSMREMKIIYTPDEATGISGKSLVAPMSTNVKILHTEKNITIILKGDVKKSGACTIYNLQGKKVVRVHPESKSGQRIVYRINSSRLSPQVYIMRIELGTGSLVRKLMMGSGW